MCAPVLATDSSAEEALFSLTPGFVELIRGHAKDEEFHGFSDLKLYRVHITCSLSYGYLRTCSFVELIYLTFIQSYFS